MQAVILAGGKGERLRPLTYVMPKAMAVVNGTPIIKKQIENLISLGIKDVLILTGYKSEIIRYYLEEVFKGYEIQITCLATPLDFSPAERLLNASKKINQSFILLYCDNLVTDLASIGKVISSKYPITFLAEKREKGNLKVQGKVVYEIERGERTPFVELGYIKIQDKSFFKVLKKTNSLQLTLRQMTLALDCDAILTTDSLVSVSDISRFNSNRVNRNTILLDRDGILNEKMPHRKYLSDLEQYKPLEENIESLAQLFSDSTDFIIITNQPGVSTGELDPEFLESLHSKMLVELQLKGIPVIGIYVCNHHWNDKCECRKPKPGMINRAILDFNLDRGRLVYIGDETKDLEAALAAEILGVRISNDSGDGSFESIRAAFPAIEARINQSS